MPRREMLECCISVLGQCCGGSSDPHSQVGVGKSALCSRFLHPDVDTWVELGYDHSHWLSQTDFSESEINGEHFLYYGAARRRYCPRGKAFSSEVKDLSVHVVEHTTFCNDVLSQPFPGSGNYARRATADQVKSRASGKVTYATRSALGDEDYCVEGTGRQPFTSRFCKTPFCKAGGVDGYVFVLDPTTSANDRAKQWQLWQDCWEQITSDKRGQCVLVLSKCDELDATQRAKLNKTMKVVEFFTCTTTSPANRRREVPRNKASQFHDCPGKMAISTSKHIIPVFFTSAESAISVDLPFLYLAHLSLKLSGRPQGAVKWTSALQAKAELEKKSLLALHGFLRTQVKSRSKTWDGVGRNARSVQLQCCRTLHGVQVCKAAFKSHILSLVFEDAENMAKEQYANTLQAKKRGVRQQQHQEPASTRDRRVCSLASRLAREHPDLLEYVKNRADSRGTDYELLHFHSARLQSVARSIVQRPIEAAAHDPDECDATSEEPIYAEIGNVAAPLMPANTIYESTKMWKKFDQHLMQSLDKLKTRAVDQGDYERLETLPDGFDVESEGNSLTSRSPLVDESKSDDGYAQCGAAETCPTRRIPSPSSHCPATLPASQELGPMTDVPIHGAVLQSSEGIHHPTGDNVQCRGDSGHRTSTSQYCSPPNAVPRRSPTRSCASQANCLVVANKAARTSYMSIDGLPSESAC